MDIMENGFGMLPNKVLFDKELSSTSKLIYSYITSLSAKDGYCWASNKFIGDKFGVSSKTISVNISQLENCGYIRVEIKKFYRRNIFLLGVLQKGKGGITKTSNPLLQKGKDNNISELDKLNKKDKYISIRDHFKIKNI